MRRLIPSRLATRFLGIFLAVQVFCGASGLLAQTPEAAESMQPLEVPSGPLLNDAPLFSKWTVTSSVQQNNTSGAAPRSGNEMRGMTVTKTKDVICEEFTDAKGLRSEVWHVGVNQFTKPPGDTLWYQAGPAANNNGTANMNYRPLPANGFRGWDWINRDTYVGTTSLESGTCLVFVPGGPAKIRLTGSKDAEKLSVQPLVAFVDAKTRLPVALRSGATTQRFVFANAPTEMQALPADLLEQIKKATEGRDRLFQPAARPY